MALDTLRSGLRNALREGNAVRHEYEHHEVGVLLMLDGLTIQQRQWHTLSKETAKP